MPRSIIKPLVSAIGMKSLGPINPLDGWFQRIKASAEKISPETVFTLG